MPASTPLPSSLSSRGLRRLLQLLLTYRWHTLGGLAGVVVSDVVQLSVPWVTKTVVDRLEARSVEASELLAWGALVLFLGLLSFLSKQLWRRLILGASKRVEADLRHKLLEKTLGMTMGQAQATEAGKFMALASNDIPAVGQALAFGVIAFFDSIFITLVASALMFQLSPVLTAWALLPFPLLGLFLAISMRLIYSRWDAAQQTLEEVTEKVRESLLGMRTLRAFVQRSGDLTSFERRNDRYFQAMMDYVRVDATFSPLVLLFAGSSSAVLIYVGGGQVLAGQLSLGSLAAFIGYLSILTWPMIAAGWMLVLLQRGSASIDRLDQILEAPSEAPHQGAPAPRGGVLEVRHLTFSYPRGGPVIQDWSLTCRPGQVIALVGPVGSGKSTLFRLLQALETPPPGTLWVDGQDLTDLGKEEVRKLFAPVAQEPFLFSDTIANNLRLGAAQATEEELRQAVALADLEDDLALFPLGLETELGERGISLSGGQRQRAALARAWLKAAPFLLLDDTLSAVDTLTEQRILRHLKEQPGAVARGILIVSHRLSAVRDADEILVIDQGRVVDRGRHEELAARPGLYAELLQHQNAQEAADARAR